MPEINLDLAYFDWPETRRLIGLLGRGAEVLPLRLKTYCGSVQAETGRLSNHSAREVESVIEWWGAPETCVAALLKVGYLRQVQDGYEVMERDGVPWLEAQGHIAAFQIRARKAAQARYAKISGEPPRVSNASSNAKEPPKQHPNERAVEPPDGGSRARGREYEVIFRLWAQLIVPPIRKVREITKSRHAAARARWAEHPEEAYWRDVIERIARSSFCRGQNDRQWIADIEFLLRPDTGAKALEGKYDDKTPKGPAAPPPAPKGPWSCEWCQRGEAQGARPAKNAWGGSICTDCERKDAKAPMEAAP